MASKILRNDGDAPERHAVYASEFFVAPAKMVPSIEHDFDFYSNLAGVLFIALVDGALHTYRMMRGGEPVFERETTDDDFQIAELRWSPIIRKLR